MAEARNPSRYAWVVVALLFIVALLNYLDRLMITTMRDPIRAEFTITDAQFGLITAVFLWVYAALSPLGGYLADRFSRSGVIVASLLFWSSATLLSGIARTYHELLWARALMGVSEACYIPAALALISDYHRGRTRSLATGLHMAGIYAGAALGGVGGYIAEQFGWRAGFKGFGLVGIGYAIVLALSLRDMRNEPEMGPEIDEVAEPNVRPGAALAELFGNNGFRILFALNVMVGLANWAIYNWLPAYLKEHFRLGLGAAGLSATAYIQVASFAGVLVGGALADRWSRTNRRARALIPAIGFLAAGPCLMASASTSLLPIAVAGLIVFGLGRGAFDANHMPILRELVDQRYSATGYGLLNMISTASGGVMIYTAGAMMDAHISLAAVFKVCGAGLVLCGLLLGAVRFQSVQEPSKELVA
jgi:MFS family permease